MKPVRTDGIIRAVSGEQLTPFNCALKFNAAVILESASLDKGRERYSLLMLDEAFRVFQKDNDIFIKADEKVRKIKKKGNDILDILSHFAHQHRDLHQDIPFPAGGIGYLSYEYAEHFDKISIRKRDDNLTPYSSCFLFGHIFLIFDHYTDLVYIIGLNYNEHEIDLKSAVSRVEERLFDFNFNYLTKSGKNFDIEEVTSIPSKEIYKSGVDSIKKEIIKGNLLQGVLSRRLKIKTDLPAIEAYRKLRTENPSPYMFFLDFKDFQLLGTSPEMHAKVKDGTAYLNPIAGTRPRGTSKTRDNLLEKEMLSDEKEKAEHLMLVDLGRNDLGRVCKSGTIQVSSFMKVERYSHVMHLVSNIEGTLEEGKTGSDVIRATFPAGTVSGAPKIKAIETVDKLESNRRGFYAGLVGYMEPDGNIDTCIVIRSAMKKEDHLYLQAGAGIVYDSVPENEYIETEHKLAALAKAIGLEV